MFYLMLCLHQFTIWTTIQFLSVMWQGGVDVYQVANISKSWVQLKGAMCKHGARVAMYLASMILISMFTGICGRVNLPLFSGLPQE